MHRLPPLALALALLAPACGPKQAGDTETDATDTTDTTDATTSTAATTDAGSTTAATDPDSTTADPTEALTDPTGDPPVACGDPLPPEGSPCATEGEDCAPNASECDPYIGAMCIDGAWDHYEVGPGDPDRCPDPTDCNPDDPLPREGSPCEHEGDSCGGPCADPCQFCNIMQCTEGTWQHLEVFPNECLGCEDVCEFVVAAECAGGPPDLETCVAGCEQNLAGRCALLHNQMLGCIGGAPSFACDAMDRPVVVGCEARFDALYACTMP